MFHTQNHVLFCRLSRGSTSFCTYLRSLLCIFFGCMFEYLSVLARPDIPTRFRNCLLSSHKLSKLPDFSASPRRTSFYSMPCGTTPKTLSDSRHLCCSMSPEDLDQTNTNNTDEHMTLTTYPCQKKLVRKGVKIQEKIKIL